MDDLKISKSAFIDQDPDISVKRRIFSRIAMDQGYRFSIVKRYRHRFKIVALPVLAMFFGFGRFMIYQNNNTSTLNQEITKTKNAINDFVSLNDNEIF